MQNTFSQSGNDSRWFLKKSFFIIGMWNSSPPPFMEKTILNFHFDYLNPRLRWSWSMIIGIKVLKIDEVRVNTVRIEPSIKIMTTRWYFLMWGGVSVFPPSSWESHHHHYSVWCSNSSLGDSQYKLDITLDHYDSFPVTIYISFVFFFMCKVTRKSFSIKKVHFLFC